jgi:nucleoid DNA-binding protein
MTTVNKQALIEAAAARNNTVPKSAVADIVQAAFDGIVGAVARGDEVQLHGFGTFTRKHREAHEGRNVRTGETITIGAKNAPHFKAAKGFKAALNG